jgi:hypothetical protein
MDMNLYYRMAAIADVLFIRKVLVQYRLHEGSDTELLNRTAGGTFWYGTMAERVDAIAYLMRSDRADSPEYRKWLSERLLAAHAHQSTAIHPCVPEMYHSWDNRKAILLDEIERVLPGGEPFIVIDDGQLGLYETFNGRRVIPFLERDGRYWGAPDHAGEAIENLERLGATGVRWLVIGWPAFWWLDQYGSFDQYLRTRCRPVMQSPHGTVFQLPAD